MKILFAISQTTDCQKSIENIKKFFGNAVELTLFHAISKEMNYIDCKMMGYFSPQEDEIQDEDWQLLNDFQSQFTQANLQCQKILKIGNPIDEILQIAENFDLLIIGYSESTFLPKIFTSHQSGIIDSSPIPVLIIK